MYQCTSENDFHLHGIFLSYIGASGGTRINTGFLAHLYISLSQARGQRTAERLKVSSTFSKVAGCGTASHGPKGVARTVGPAFPYSQKGGTNVPLLGWHRDRGFCLRMGRAGCLRARSSGYRLRRMRRLRCFFSTGCAGFRPWSSAPHLANF